MYVYVFVFFFFKQKTAYEMRISDWSSDVCSSDLDLGRQRSGRPANSAACRAGAGRRHPVRPLRAAAGARRCNGYTRLPRPAGGALHDAQGRSRDRRRAGAARSEEHTSELQSLMRISYAVFCLTKKKKTKTQAKKK